MQNANLNKQSEIFFLLDEDAELLAKLEAELGVVRERIASVESEAAAELELEQNTIIEEIFYLKRQMA
jgi:hypothetical protein